MEDGEREDSSDEFEVVQMLGVDRRVGVDLKCVVVVLFSPQKMSTEPRRKRKRERRGAYSRVLEQTVERVEHLVRQQEEELSRQSSVIQTIFSVELDHQSLLEVVWCLAHNLGVRIFEDVSSTNFDVTLTRRRTKGGLRSEVDEFSSEVSLVLRYILIE